MDLTFGYEDFIDGIPISNGFKPDFKNRISSINLGWAGYQMDVSITDNEIINNQGKTDLYYGNHYAFLVTHYPSMKIKKISDIKQKYYYVIDIYPPEFWSDIRARDIKFTEKALTDILSGQAKILLFMCTESIPLDGTFVIDLLNSWIAKYKLPKKSIVISSGNHLAQEYFKDSEYITHIPVISGELLLSSCYNEEDHTTQLEKYILSKGDRDKLYLCYNRRVHYHRLKLVYMLYKENLLNLGVVSLRTPRQEDKLDFVEQEFYDILPFTIDDVDLEIGLAESVITKDFKRTFFTVITETHHDDTDIFMTEKIFKPIVSFHPFFVLTSIHFLNKMKEIGYKTFSKWFDESYDIEPDLDKRIRIICDEIKRLSKLSQHELKDMLNDMVPVLRHNYNNFIERTTNQEYPEKLLEELCR